MSLQPFAIKRNRMVADQLAARGIRDPKVLEVMRKVPRHLFVSPEHRTEGYDDRPIPIGWGQTISQPYIVALMTEQLQVQPGSRILEVGTGSGYQAALLAELGATVYSIERIPELAEGAAQHLKAAGISTLQIRVGDGSKGWPEVAPFAGIVVAACAPHVPELLVEQLAENGRLVIPIGESLNQRLTVVQRLKDGLQTHEICGCVFVPLVGE